MEDNCGIFLDYDLDLGGLKMEEKEFSQDIEFLTSIISKICDYAVDNGLNPTDTVKTVANHLIALSQVASFDDWHKENKNS